jgi:hypothetical protein
VFDEQDADAFVTQPTQQIAERLFFEEAQTGGWFVEQQQAGIGGQRTRDFDQPLFAERQTAGSAGQVLEEAADLVSSAIFAAASRSACAARCGATTSYSGLLTTGKIACRGSPQRAAMVNATCSAPRSNSVCSVASSNLEKGCFIG